MAEATNYLFDYQEVAEALIKKQDLHEGLWQIAIEFGFGAQNIRSPIGFAPAAIIPVQRVGLVRTQEANNMTVNAAEVNPASAGSKTTKAGTKRATKRAIKK